MLGSPNDLETMLRDAGEPVAYNGAGSFGIVDRSATLVSVDGAGAQVQARVTTCLIATDVFDDLHQDAIFVISDVEHTIDTIDPQDDGALTLLTVSRVP